MAVQSNELRIGNWVTILKRTSGYFYQIASGHDIEETAKRPASINPIPITPEILLAAWFEIIDGQITLFKKDKVYMYWDDQDKELSANFGHIEQLDVAIKYVHQLQNLYFALTGIELTIKL